MERARLNFLFLLGMPFLVLASLTAAFVRASDLYILRWLRRLEQIVHHSTRSDVLEYLRKTVLPAMEQVASELRKRGVEATVHSEEVADGTLRLTIPDPLMRDFVYGVKVQERTLPVFLVREAAKSSANTQVFEPITFFADGRLGYDIQYLRPEELIADILRHYERYRAITGDERTQLLNRAPGHTDAL